MVKRVEYLEHGIDWKAEQEKEKHCGREDGELKRRRRRRGG